MIDSVPPIEGSFGKNSGGTTTEHCPLLAPEPADEVARILEVPFTPPRRPVYLTHSTSPAIYFCFWKGTQSAGDSVGLQFLALYIGDGSNVPELYKQEILWNHRGTKPNLDSEGKNQVYFRLIIFYPDLLEKMVAQAFLQEWNNANEGPLGSGLQWLPV